MKLDTRIMLYINDHGPSSSDKIISDLRLKDSELDFEKAILRLMIKGGVSYNASGDYYLVGRTKRY